MDYIRTVIQNFHNLEEFCRLWLHSAAMYVIFAWAVNLVGLFCVNHSKKGGI